MPLFPSREKCSYFNCFCEENVWKLCDTVRCKNPALVQHCFAVFISNEQKMVPIWQNRGSQAEDGMVIWDYHVVFVYKSPDGPEVYDMDSTLPFPVPIAK